MSALASRYPPPRRTLRVLVATALVLAAAGPVAGQSSNALVQAEELVRQGRFAAAEAALARILAAGPNAQALYLRGFALIQLYRFEEAEGSLREAVELEPRRASWLHALAKALLEQGQNAAAIEVLDRALALEPKPEYRFAKAMCALNIGELALAERELVASLEAMPRNAEAHLKLGRLRFDRGDWAAAGRSLERALEVDPELLEARYLSGLATLRSGRLEEARRELELVVAAVPGHVGALYNLGRVLQRLGDREAAAQRLAEFERMSTVADRADFLKRAVRMNPENLAGRQELAQAQLRLGRAEEAVEELLAARALAPRDAAVYRLLATALRSLGRAEEAERAERFAARLSGPG